MFSAKNMLVFSTSAHILPLIQKKSMELNRKLMLSFGLKLLSANVLHR